MWNGSFCQAAEFQGVLAINQRADMDLLSVVTQTWIKYILKVGASWFLPGDSAKSPDFEDHLAFAKIPDCGVQHPHFWQTAWLPVLASGPRFFPCPCRQGSTCHLSIPMSPPWSSNSELSPSFSPKSAPSSLPRENPEYLTLMSCLLPPCQGPFAHSPPAHCQRPVAASFGLQKQIRFGSPTKSSGPHLMQMGPAPVLTVSTFYSVSQLLLVLLWQYTEEGNTTTDQVVLVYYRSCFQKYTKWTDRIGVWVCVCVCVKMMYSKNLTMVCSTKIPRKKQ
jgi:hypothetical protein